MTEPTPRALAEEVLREISNTLDEPHADDDADTGELTACALVGIGWALLAIEKAIREQTAAEYERQAVVP